MVDDLRRVENLLHPVGAGGERVTEVGEAQHVQRGGLVAVGEFLAHQDHIVLGPKHAREFPRLGVQVARRIGDARVAFAAILGGDDDHAVGGTGSIDGARCGVLQDVHRLDVARVDVVDVAELHAVHDVKRGVVSVGADAADEDALPGSRLAAGLVDDQTGGESFECRGHVRHRYAFDVLGGDFGDRSGGDLFLLPAVSHHDHFINELGVDVEGHPDGGSRLHRQGLGHIADEAHLEGGGQPVDLQGERAVGSGACGVGGAALQNGGPDERVSGFTVEDGSGEGN